VIDAYLGDQVAGLPLAIDLSAILAMGFNWMNPDSWRLGGGFAARLAKLV
jgi:hypothetical protein